MKAHLTSPRSTLLTAIICASLALAVAASGTASAQTHQPRLTQRQLVTLLANAHSPRDHERLAHYFRSEARRLRAEARTHEQFARAYGGNTTPNNSEYFNVSRTARHCYNVAKDYLKEAREASAQAAHHELLAQQARQWPR